MTRSTSGFWVLLGFVFQFLSINLAFAELWTSSFVPRGRSFSESRFGQPPQPIQIENRKPAEVEARTSLDHTGANTAVQEIALIAGDLGYFPRVLFVTRDIPVKLFVTGSSKKSLCIVLDAFQVRRQIRTQRIEEIEFKPTTSGEFRFYCPIHGMEGILHVKDSYTGMKGN